MNPIILPVFLPHFGCRQRCLFCNQRAVASKPRSPEEVRGFIETSLSMFPSQRGERVRQVAFYGGSFSAMPKEGQMQYLRMVQSFMESGLIDSIRISTRPDCLDEDTLSFLKKGGVKTIEVGTQSMVDEVLFLNRRGHMAEDTVSSVNRLKAWGFEIGLHLMIGLPGDNGDRFLQTIDRVAGLRPDFVRIHPTLVLRGASLEALWEEGEYHPLDLDETVLWLKRGLLRLEATSVRVARIGLHLDPELEKHIVAGPYHPALHQMVESAITFDMAARLLKTRVAGPKAIFVCHPREASNFRGQRNRNISELRTRFLLDEIVVETREEVERNSLLLKTETGPSVIRRRDLMS
jgi:histone acetyltransferase (RNA polymerase elongator complex component)